LRPPPPRSALLPYTTLFRSAVLNLLGYDVTTLNDTFPTAQLNKARELGLRSDLAAGQGDTLTIADGALLLYNALTAQTAEGETRSEEHTSELQSRFDLVCRL